MSSRVVEGTAFTAALAVVFMAFLALAWRLESAGRLAPILLAGGALALTAFQLVRDVRGESAETGKEREPTRMAGFGWALALPPSIYLLGCLGGVALHTLLLVRFRGGRSWGFAGLLAMLTALPVYGLAELMARKELLVGALLRWL